MDIYQVLQILSKSTTFISFGLYSMENFLKGENATCKSCFGYSIIRTLRSFVYREPEPVFVPQMFVPQIFVPENGQSWQPVGCLLFQASRALALTRT